MFSSSSTFTIGTIERIFASIPVELYASVAVGIGLFIAFIGFRNAGIVVSDKATSVALGNLRDPHTLLSLFGLVLTAGLLARGFRAAMLAGILATTAAAPVSGLIDWRPRPYSVGEITATAFQLDIPGALRLGLLEILFVFLFVDLFDNIGTLVAVGTRRLVRRQRVHPSRQPHPTYGRHGDHLRIGGGDLDRGV